MTSPTQKTNLNIAPFFDDYNEDDGYHRILFKPRTVQAREVNQLQSILQNQINRFGKHVFDDGSVVLDGGSRIIDNQASIEVTLSSATIDDLLALDKEIYIQSNTTGLTGKIKKIVPASGGVGICFFIDYQNSGSDGVTTAFVAGEGCQCYTLLNGVITPVANATIVSVGSGVLFKLLKGVYFVRGHFVLTEELDVVISKLTQNASVRVGLNVVESIIDETIDEDLYSNALGYPNFKGPGAARLQLKLELKTKPLTDVGSDISFIELARFENGVLSKQIKTTEYSLLGDTLAQRTYEESGDYTVEAFPIAITNHLREAVVDGVYTTAQGGDATKLVAQVKAGIAYVKGYRVENIGVQNVTLNRARDTGLINNGVVAAEYGQYLLVENMSSSLDCDITQRVQFWDASNLTIGDCAVRAMQRNDTGVYRVYVFDVKFNAGKSIADAETLHYSDLNNLFSADLVQQVIFDSTKNSLVFRLPYDSVSTLKPSGSSDTTYSVLRAYDVTLNSSGVGAINLTTNELFAAVNSYEYIVTDTGATNGGAVYANSSLTLGGSPIGKALNINIPAAANGTVKVLAPIIKQSPTNKTKTSTTTTEALVLTAQSKVTLSKADVYSIVSITDTTGTPVDVTSLFVLDNGQRANWYESASISTANGLPVTMNIVIEYKYFAHSAGDYFTVDSYVGLDREDIPKFSVGGASVSLADCIDYRPLKAASGVFTPVTVQGEIVKPSDNVRFDLEYFLNRIDCLWVDVDGNFGVSDGVPSDFPVAPSVPTNAMKLYELFVPAYTESPDDVRIKYIENKRYTMRDIGKLEKRIDNVEYYVTLSELENKTNSTQVIDPITGNDRFKNGFAVDGFTDFRLADIGNSEYAASMDTANGILKPTFIENVLDLSSATYSNTTKKTDLYTLAYTEVVSTKQIYATTTSNINPYAVFTWAGSIKLSPVSDFWKDTKYLQPVIVNNTQNLRGNATQGTTWESWARTFDIQSAPSDIRSGFRVVNGSSNLEVQTGVTTTFTETSNSTVRDSLISTSVIPFMRSIDIKFNTKNYRPFTRLYPFFNSVDVGAYCKQDGKNYGDEIITDEAGIVSGVFTVPNTSSVHFATGTGTFKLSSNSNPLVRIDDETTGESIFLSGGTLETRRQNITNTRILTATQTQTRQWRVAQNRDPIAQTFRVVESGGAFISKIDIFFSTKAESLPVTLQIRTVENGIPTESVLPIAEKDLLPTQVITTTDASVATSFVFDDLIYLEEGKEYAIVLLADTQEYNVYVAALGENVIGKQLAVSKQPHIGVFFSSSNGSTWTPYQNKDLMFTVYRAEFNSASAGVVTYTGAAPSGLPAEVNCFTSLLGSNDVTVSFKSHGLKAGDSVTITGASTGNGILDTDMNKTHVVASVTSVDKFVVVATSTATATGAFGGSSIIVQSNFAFSDFYTNVESMVLPNTKVEYAYQYKLQTSRAFSDWIGFEPKSSVPVTDEGVFITGTDFKVRATFTSTKSNLSPVIDASGLTTVFVHQRVSPDADVFSYVTKNITFDNPSSSAKFFVGAKLPSNTTMKFYYKLLNTSDEDLALSSWTELASDNPIVNDSKNYIEYQYTLDNVGSFVGYKIKVVLYGSDPCDSPALTDFRSIALA